MFGIADNIKQLLQNSMPLWKTQLYHGRNNLGTVNIKRGMFQGDSFSPLLFVIALIPISRVLQNVRMGYKVDKQGLSINHMLFMDDLKLFGKLMNEIDSLVKTVETCSSDIGMVFGIAKCPVLNLKRGKLVTCDGIELQAGDKIESVDERGYRYLGVLKVDQVLHGEMKERIRALYYDRLKKLLKSKLNAGNLIKAINTWAVASVRYSAAIVDWTKEELRQMDRKTRKLLTMHGGLHPKSDVDRLHLPRKLGGRGTCSIEDCVEEERRSIAMYLSQTQEELLKFARTKLKLPTQNESKLEFKNRKENEKISAWKEKRLHGQFAKDTDAIKTNESFNWLCKGELKRETESLILAAQEQALNTNSIKARIYRLQENDKCRLCGAAVENVTHIISGCKKLAQKEYKRRHDKVASFIHWLLCKKYDLKYTEKLYQHQPAPVVENDRHKLLWDFSMQTDRVIEHRRPDIVIVDWKEKECAIIDVASHGDQNIEDKEWEKISKYSELKLEVMRLWTIKTKVIPIVVGALGSIPKS
eukprot:Seg1367.7 transcript_id=Seg1367.7/GoldUCD/mRNA.D3Y31 product="Retrovirus-related Pol polyprotein from type-1 retrotransposable element R2" pseudo=true protein_id=Seg1367.7/GoldUCD/D3Y31